MEIFELIIDRKATVWERSYVDVEANSLEEAIAKCNSGELAEDEAEVLYDTLTYLKPTAEDPCTVEIFNRSEYTPVYTNDISC